MLSALSGYRTHMLVIAYVAYTLWQAFETGQLNPDEVKEILGAGMVSTLREGLKAS
jgi:phenylalanine-4-hydroxylase